MTLMGAISSKSKESQLERSRKICGQFWEVLLYKERNQALVRMDILASRTFKMDESS